MGDGVVAGKGWGGDGADVGRFRLEREAIV